MRKVLLTVLTVSSLLAFNACKKDGATGPAGPAGATGATGAAGPAGAVGPQGAAGVPGATGAAGSKILSGTVDPVTADGAVGDYFFNKTTKTLWGPKVAAGWAGTSTALTGADGAKGATGANGATGATGTNGTQFLAGAGAPTATSPSNAVTGDFYFDTTTGVFYGPKQADGTWTNTMPLGSAYAAKTYNLTRGFEAVTETSKVFGADLVNTYSNYNIFSSYQVSANDMIRIAQYPTRADGSGGWGENREMVFETVPGNNQFTSVPQAASDLGSSTDEGVGTIRGFANMQVGAKFRYSHNTVNPLAEFTLTQSDIDRLKVNGGANFGLLTYAKALPSTVALGQNLTFATNKNTQVKTSSTNYYATYSARTSFNLNTLIPNLEKYKQDGKVFLKYRYYTAGSLTPATNNVLDVHAGIDAGWVDLSYYINSYATGANAYSTYAVGTNPFALSNPTTHPFATPNIMGSGAALGINPVTFGINQLATPTAGSGTTATTYNNGNVIMNWNIQSGINAGAVSTYVGPTQLQNAGPVADPVSVAFLNPSPTTASYIARNFALNYYSAQVTPATLTASNNAGTTIAVNPGDFLNVIGNKGGVDAAAIGNYKLVRLQVFVIPGDIITSLKAKGVDTDNLSAIQANVKL